MHYDDLGVAENARDCSNVAEKYETELVVERRVDRTRRADHKKCVAVARRAKDRLCCDICTPARPVLDNEWPAEPLLQPLTDQSREDVGRPPAAKPTMMRTGRVG